MNLIVNNSKVSHNVTHDVVLSTVVQLYILPQVWFVLAQEIEAHVVYFLHENIKSWLTSYKKN